MTKQTIFINKIKEEAIQGWYTNKILPSVSIAQAILESGWGQSKLCIEANNLFGIKIGKDWHGDKFKIVTAEYGANNNKYFITAYFRKYKSWGDSIKDHSNFFESTSWRKNNYSDFIGETDYIKACYSLQQKDLNGKRKAGSKKPYATSNIYEKQLIELIERYKLFEFDKIALKEKESEERKMKIFLSVGHSLLKGGKCTSANGFVNEYNYNKKLAPFVKKEIEKAGHSCDVIICPEYRFYNKAQERAYKIPIANKGVYDIVCELHLNASSGAGHGVEVYYYKGDTKGLRIANRVCKEVNKLGFTNRGSKVKDLYMINETIPTAVLLELFFCDNKKDCEIAERAGYEKMAKAIAKGLLGNIPPRKKQCVMYFKDANEHTARAIAYIKGVPCFKDNGRDLPNSQHSQWDILYVGNLGKNRQETCKLAFNKFLNTNF